MVGNRAMKQWIQRRRRPGDLFFAALFLLLSLYLLSRLPSQAQWISGTRWSSQPALWPALSLGGMCLFALLNLIGSAVSPKMEGRWREVALWLRAVEFIVWFLLYVAMVPWLGYLPSTMLFTVLLSIRAGYRSSKMIGLSLLAAISVVVVFKSLLQVRVAGGELYEYLPVFLRTFMLTYF